MTRAMNTWAAGEYDDPEGHHTEGNMSEIQ